MSIAKIAALVVAGMLMSSCSAIMAANQPGRVNLEVLSEGSDQSLVRAELGSPVSSDKDAQGFDIEIFQFTQGYSGLNRVARIWWHLGADLVTWGLWDQVGSAIESRYSGTKMNAVVTYDEQQKVKSVRLQDIQGNVIPVKRKSEE
ncbi:hypothetical protein MELA_02308 [Candidatus Methylomirabilis lanthanidiphila]|uniref:Lipoprotein n=1 Tax=Candidatus Methylomirabilis lanthanidiphila TaxID=2211376 RepID=A0A564ZKS8_9BACT|nr:hypothetical protein [Candidatus Methylomirabilis lanthanidiphila]VUZ85921.1 hypothetical protein MELA_02308 [Candidatus Methylomirabilis lanthanidiphila]